MFSGSFEAGRAPLDGHRGAQSGGKMQRYISYPPSVGLFDFISVRKPRIDLLRLL